jgi:hypothetical protein
MAAEPNRPKTGMILFVTALSLILLLVSVLVIEGLFYVWQTRAQEKAGEGNLPSQVDVYKKEQVARLTDIDQFKASVIQDARAGKNLAPPAPPDAPSKPGAPTDKQGSAPPPPPGKNIATPGKTEPPAKIPEKK